MDDIVTANITKKIRREQKSKITFSNENAIGVLLYDNEHVVVKVQCNNFDVKRVLFDPGSSTNVLIRSPFQRHHLNPDNVRALQGSLVGLSGE